jgi:predicted short-subunit dehydrogenase-like oxidoreductase (DUF2520 family)
MKTLNVLGAGRVGRSLAALWTAKRAFALQDVLDGSFAGARSAVAFAGAGEAVERFEALRPADVWMLTTPDREIRTSCDRVACAGLLRASDVVFHCSGSMSSVDLAAAAAVGAGVASVHPLKSFADPAESVRTFEGTHCAAEGSIEALEVLAPAFECIGARVSRIDAASKTLYHAASVIVCNYLTALIEAGLRCYESAGIPRGTAATMIEPIVRQTVHNVFRLGTAGALTGPIARGDDGVVLHHLAALQSSEPRLAALYRELGTIALDLARLQGVEAEPLARVVRALDSLP